MDVALETLPDDPAVLRALVLETRAELVRIEGELANVSERNERLEAILAQLRRMHFGRHSEKLSPDQLDLALEDLEQAAAEIGTEEEKANPEIKRTRSAERRSRRGALPAHLPRVDVVIEPEDTACPCCGGAMHVIGEDCSQRLDVVPAQYRVIVTHRPKYACRSCEGAVVQAAAPARLIEGGLPTERLVARVLVAKYADHAPLYRQAQMLAREGIAIDRATLASWVGCAAAELRPLWRLLKADILASPKIFADETTVPVLDPGRGRTKTGYLWAIARDDRPWGGKGPPAVVYSYAPGRSTEHAAALLKDYSGILQTDGYQVYKTLAEREREGDPPVLANCWAHARRPFYEIVSKAKAKDGLAGQMLKRIAALYEIEEQIRGKSAAERRAASQEKTKLLADEIHDWCVARLKEVSGKSTLAQAFRYILNHWDGLTRFLDDGRIEIDSNTVERSMRPIALNRKNALFAGHDEGGRNWAVIASLIETCKLNGVNPEAYLADILARLVDNWPNSRIAELTPGAWAAATPR
jgi:transposase